MPDEAKHSNPFFSKVEKCHLAPSATNGTIYSKGIRYGLITRIVLFLYYPFADEQERFLLPVSVVVPKINKTYFTIGDQLGK